MGVGGGRAPWPQTEPKARGQDRRGTGVPTAPAPHDLRPFPAQEEDVGDERGAAALGSNLGAVPGSPDLRWGRGRLLHAGPEPRASDARVLLLCGSSGPAFPGRLQNEELHHLLQRPAVPGHVLLPPETQPQRALRGLLPFPLALRQGTQLPTLRRPARGLHAPSGRGPRAPAPLLLRRRRGPGCALRAGAPAASGHEWASLPPSAGARGRRGPGAIGPGLRAQRLLRVRARRARAALARALAGPPFRTHHGPGPTPACCPAALNRGPATAGTRSAPGRRAAHAPPRERASRVRVRGEGAPRPRPAGAVRGGAADRVPTPAGAGSPGPYSLHTLPAWGVFVLWSAWPSRRRIGAAGREARGLQCASPSGARPSPAGCCSVGRGSAGEPRRGSVR